MGFIWVQFPVCAHNSETIFCHFSAGARHPLGKQSYVKTAVGMNQWFFWYGQAFELRVLMQHEMLHVCIKLGHHRHRCLVFTIWFGWPLHQWEKQTDLRVTNQNCCLLASWKHKCCLMFTIRFENLTGVPLYTGIARRKGWFFFNGIKLVSRCVQMVRSWSFICFLRWKPVARLLRMINGWRIQSWWWRTSFAFSSLTSPPLAGCPLCNLSQQIQKHKNTKT